MASCRRLITLSLFLSQSIETTSFAPQLKHPPRDVFQAREMTRQPEEGEELSTNSKVRRDLISALPACVVLTLTQPPKPSLAEYVFTDEANNLDTFQFQITTSLPKGFSPQELGPNSALLITVKPAVTYSDQVPKQIADASLKTTGHWVPIVLESRQLCSQLDLCDQPAVTTTLTLDHVTPQAGTDWNWWKELPLIVTAKLDADNGLDASKDLVGCRILPNMNGGLLQVPGGQVTMPLQRRGLCSEMLLSNLKKGQ